MRAKVYYGMARKGITLLAIPLLFTVFPGEFGCKRQAAVSQPEDFKYLEGTFVQRVKNGAEGTVHSRISSSKGAKGRLTTITINGLPLESLSLNAPKFV